MVETVRAQSALALYGELDGGLAWLNNVGGRRQYKVTSGLIDGSFWGLQGFEDLGGGSKAIFQIERGLSMTSGNSLDDHPFYVGISSETLGTVTIGYQYDPIHDYLAPFTMTGGTGGTAFAHPFDNDNANNSYLAHNALKYESQSFSGLRFGGMYALSNAAGRFSNNRAYGVGASYQDGPLNAGAAWLHVSGVGSNESGAYDAMTMYGAQRSVFDAIVQSRDSYGVGVTYAFSGVTLGGAWSRSTFTEITDSNGGSEMPSMGFSNYELNAAFQLMPSVSLAGSYTYTKGSNQHWHLGGIQAVDRLSKRTDVYAEAIYQRSSNDAPALINGSDPSSSRNQLLVGAGIRHRF
nr:porin [Caballeronia pedi]